jgi:hypothetical protein
VPDPEARLHAYRKLDLKGLISPQRVLDFETRRFEALDLRFGVTIGKFIVDNFRSRPLFHTVNRPGAPVLAMLLEHLFTALKIDLPSSALPVAEFDALDAIEVPIHPKVAETLEMTWVAPDRIYKVDGRIMDWEAFVRAYIARYS